MLLRIFRFHSLQQHTSQGKQLLPLLFRDAADDPLKVTADGSFDLAAGIQPLFRGAHQRFAAVIGVCDPLNESILFQLAQRAGNSGQGLFDGGSQIGNIDGAILAMLFNGHQHAFQHDEMALGAAFQCHFGTAFAFRAQPMQIMDQGEQFRCALLRHTIPPYHLTDTNT